MSRDNLTERTDGGPSRRTILKTVGVSAAVATGVGGMGTASAASGTYTSNDYDGRYYGKYLPSSYDGSEPVPLVMMLHGCSQNADGFNFCQGGVPFLKESFERASLSRDPENLRFSDDTAVSGATE